MISMCCVLRLTFVISMTGRADGQRLFLCCITLIAKSLLVSTVFLCEKKCFLAVFVSVKWLIPERISGKTRGSKRMRIQLLKYCNY